jgi:hypothetical protein
MYKIKKITFDLPDLGKVVELVELNADQFFDANEQSAAAGGGRASQFVWLSWMLWVDGQQFSAEEIRSWGASVTVPMLTRMTELFPKTFLEDVEELEEEAALTGEEPDPNV